MRERNFALERPTVGAGGGPCKARLGAAIHYRAIEKRYGEVQAILPTTMEIALGEFFSVIGPSGSGKTTLLGVTVGFVTPTSGQIIVNGTDIVGMPPFHRNIGMVFQNYSLFPHMTVAENIAFPLRMRKRPKAEIRERVARMLSMVRLGGMEDRRPSQISGGQRQRVALARASIYNPFLLLMDEPLSALDKKLREEMQVEIKQFQQALGTTVLYVTHDQNEAASMSDRIAIMNHGRIEQIGTPQALYRAPRNRFVASFLGDANLFDVTETLGTASGCVEVRVADRLILKGHSELARLDGTLVACVRPECIMLGREPGPGENCVKGQTTSVVHSAGTVLVRVEIESGHSIMQRITAGRGDYIPELGEHVFLSWGAENTRILNN